MAMDGTWSVITLGFTCDTGTRGEIARLLVQAFLKEECGWFTAWEPYVSDGRYVVLGGIRCKDTEERKVRMERLREGLAKCNCFVVALECSDTWCGGRQESLDGEVRGSRVVRMDGVLGIDPFSCWWNRWEAFDVEPGKADEWLKRDDFDGEEMESLEVLVRMLDDEEMMEQVLSDEEVEERRPRRKELEKRTEERMLRLLEWRSVQEMCDRWLARTFGEDEEEYVRKHRESLMTGYRLFGGRG